MLAGPGQGGGGSTPCPSRTWTWYEHNRLAEIRSDLCKSNTEIHQATLITHSADTKDTVFLRVCASKEDLKQPRPYCQARQFRLFPQGFISIYRGTFSKRRAPEGEAGGATSPWKQRERLLQVSVPIMGGSVLLGASSGRSPTTVLCEGRVTRACGGPAPAPRSPLCCCSGHFPPHTSLPSSNPSSGTCTWGSRPAMSPGVWLVPTR